MQIPKEEIEQKILDAARKEFADKGFTRASVRRIASVAGVSTSNIYNYFKSKDDLFAGIVGPIVTKINRRFDFMESGEEYRNPDKWSYAYHLQMLNALAGFIDAEREVLKLLAFQSHGSSFQNYRETLIDRYTLVSLKFMRESQSLYPGLKAEISPFFAHNIASFWMNVILEILMHDVPRAEMTVFLREVMRFMFYGYEGLTEYDFSNMRPKPLS